MTVLSISTTSESFDRQEYYHWHRNLDWRKLAAFELAGLYPRGLYVIFLAMFVQEEETRPYASPLAEARIKTLLQGLVHAVYSLLSDWEAAILEFCSDGGPEEYLREIAQAQLESFSNVRQTLSSTVRCFRKEGQLRFDGGFCTRDVQNNLLIVQSRAVSQPDEAEFFSRQLLMLELVQAFNEAPDAYNQT